MFVLVSVVVLAVSVQVIFSQGHGPPPDVPAQCRGPPPGVDRPFDCCKIPPFFEEKDFEECGFQKHEDGAGPPPGGHGPGPRPPPDCTKPLCILDKYKLSKDGDVDDEAVKAFMDDYAKDNEVFKDAIESAKEKCLGKELPGPPHVCNANKVLFCVTSTLFKNCPVWEDTDTCKTLKAHMEECEPYFKRH